MGPEGYMIRVGRIIPKKKKERERVREREGREGKGREEKRRENFKEGEKETFPFS